MKVVAQHEDWLGRARVQGSEAIAGWVLSDETDMQMAASEGFAKLRALRSRMPERDGRLHYNNFGKGVTFWNTDAEAARYVSRFQDVVSADNYWFTDEAICGRSEGGVMFATRGRPLKAARCHRAANYGRTVSRLRRLMRPARSRPVWSFVEVGHPWSGSDGRTIRPAEVRAAAWSGLIHGARGIVYFNHSFGGPNQTQHALRDPAYAAIRSAVSATNRRIAALAPVLNAPTVSSGWTQGAGTTAIVKWANGHFYVLAGSAGSAVTGSFSIPCVGSASATVLDEGRAIPVNGGSFADSFADGNAVHIYRIDGGSTCGLPTTAQPAPGARGPSVPRNLSRRTTARVGRLPRRLSLRSGRLVVPVRCAGACTVRSRLTMRGGSRRINLAANKRRFGAGRQRLLLRLSKRARHRMARAPRPLSVRLHTVILGPRGTTARRTQHLIVRR